MKQMTGRGTMAALTALPFAVALVVELVLFAVLRDRLPDPLATHFAGTVPDGFTGRTGFAALSAGLTVGTGALFVLAGTRRGTFARWSVVTGYGTVGLVASALVSVLLVNADATDAAADARMPLWHLIAALLVGVVLGLVGWLATRRLTLPDSLSGQDGRDGADTGRLDLADGEVAGWTRTVSSGPLALLGLALAVLGCALAVPVGWPVAVPLALLGLLVLSFSRATITVGPGGLGVSSAALPRPRMRVPLADMSEASSRPVSPLGDFGGWGWRIRPGATGIILRSGEALVVKRANGREIAVTVDDSATAAALLNSLIPRTAPPAGSAPADASTRP
ncbi:MULTISPECIES: DUF1648 domain-containing protein [unclassified Streptomyces]|uniref:DUF1648 domain-containing protein n=1 Tax=unclassified Streptomyces TaxID=2593676 RepID=UPI000A9EDFB4|nr:DUF1648 domain-containing protein [Streptomyces sp. CB02058]